MGALKAGSAAPLFALQGTEGKTYSLSEALEHGPVLIAFFKVSCPTCQYTFPFLERLYQQFRASGIQHWAISQDDARNSQSYDREFGVTFPILIDDYPYETADAYGIKFVPTLFLIAPNGTIEFMGDGFAKADLLAIQRWFAKHFSTSPPPLFLPNERVPEFKPG
jgi:peroxiredoxin